MPGVFKKRGYCDNLASVSTHKKGTGERDREPQGSILLRWSGHGLQSWDLGNTTPVHERTEPLC